MIKRRDVVAHVLAGRPENLLAVSGLGSTTWDLSASGHHPKNFYFIGAMGQAVPFALGLAMAQPDKRVFLMTGDGEALMGIGAFATVANVQPANLGLLVMDNEHYVETGGQPTATAGPTDLEVMAKGAGFARTMTLTDTGGLDQAKQLLLEAPGPTCVVAKVPVEEQHFVFPPSFDGAIAINTFRGAILGE